MGGRVKRFNYLNDRRIGWPAIAFTVAIDNRIRGPLAALVTTLILTAVVSFVQLTRLQSAQRSYAVACARLAASTSAASAVKAFGAQVEGKARLAAHVAQLRRISIVRVNELAWIGNHLPPDTWLTALRYENGSYSLEGTSERVAAVGSAMVALRADGRAGAARLVSLHDEANSSVRHVHYTLRLEAHP